MTSKDRKEQKLDFDGARQVAEANYLPDYAAWRSALERRYTVMPPWYWNESTCRQNYASYIKSITDWQASQVRINAGISSFHQELEGSR